MSLRSSTWRHRVALFSALGLAPLTACSGKTAEGDPDPGAGGATGGTKATGGATGSGGTKASGGAVGSGGAAPGTGGTANTRTCPGEPSVGGDGKPTGFESCGDFNVHRPEKIACTATLPPVDAHCETGTQQCVSHADCTGGQNGQCVLENLPGITCFCTYGCVTDEDCGSGKICQCTSGAFGKCISATCTVDADCGSGELCLGYDTTRGCRSMAFACTTPNDECHSNKDCPGGNWCVLADGAFRCQGAGCEVGRPFLVGGVARIPPLMRRSDWCSSLAPELAGLGAGPREALASHWAEIGLMEHASIAAFARFALELLSLGAPASLIQETHAAIADETAHARDAFALASAYGGAKVGPGAFEAATASLSGRRGEDVVLTAILEGCIGETVAAMEAEEALARATDGAVRAALTRVAADEARHAALAWRFVQWVIESGPEELARAAREALRAVPASETARATATARIPVVHRVRQAPALSAHGMLDEATRRELRLRVLIDVVAPCARALRSESRRPRSASARYDSPL